MNMQDIFSEDVGSGASLVLVHGFLGIRYVGPTNKILQR